jgi:hypothetical protein
VAQSAGCYGKVGAVPLTEEPANKHSGPVLYCILNHDGHYGPTPAKFADGQDRADAADTADTADTADGLQLLPSDETVGIPPPPGYL